jgi:hypothetical protein
MTMNEKESTFWKVAPILFWAFYVIFLLSSVPHITAWYRHLDGAAYGAADLLYWGLAAGKAIAIDGADVLLTLAFLRLVTQMKSGWDGARLCIIVLCIVGFTGYSWYINWQYDVQFATNAFAKADALTLWGTSIRVTNPLVGSAFQLFALVFTLISDVILKKTEAKTAAELEAEANEFEGIAQAKQRIAKIKQENHMNTTTAFINRFKKGALEVKSAVKEVIQSEPPQSNEEASTQDDEIVRSSDNTQSIRDENDVQKSDQSESSQRSKDGETTAQRSAWNGLTGRSTVTLEKAAELLHVSITTIVTLRNKGTLKTAAKNSNLITVASLKAYTSKRSNRKQSRQTSPIKSRSKSENQTIEQSRDDVA